MASSLLFHTSPSGCGEGERQAASRPVASTEVLSEIPTEPFSAVSTCPPEKRGFLSPLTPILRDTQAFRFIAYPSDGVTGVFSRWRSKGSGEWRVVPAAADFEHPVLYDAVVPSGPGEYEVQVAAGREGCEDVSSVWTVIVESSPPAQTSAPRRFHRSDMEFLDASSCFSEDSRLVTYNLGGCTRPLSRTFTLHGSSSCTPEGGRSCIQITDSSSGYWGSSSSSSSFCSDVCGCNKSPHHFSSQDKTEKSGTCVDGGTWTEVSEGSIDSNTQVGYEPPGGCPAGAPNRVGPMPKRVGGTGGALVLEIVPTGGGIRSSSKRDVGLTLGIELNGRYPDYMEGWSCAGVTDEPDDPMDCYGDGMRWEFPPVAMSVGFDPLPPSKVRTELPDGFQEIRTAWVTGSPYAFLQPAESAPAPGRRGDLAPRRALQCPGPEDPCQADQSKCENRVACLQNNWKTNPPKKDGQDCLGGNLADCVKRMAGGGANMQCHDNSDKECSGRDGYSKGGGAVVCKDQAGENRWESTLLHELVHRCYNQFRPGDPLGSETMAETCQNACFPPCGQTTGPCSTYQPCNHDQGDVPPNQCDPTVFPRCEL